MTLFAKLCRLCLGFAFLLPLASFVARAETLTIAGVGSLTPLIKQLGDEYVKQHPGLEIKVIEPPMGSSGALRALAAGKLGLALAGRPLKAGETGKARPWLQTPLVLATMGGKLKDLTPALIADIYAGRKTAWEDGTPIRIVLRGEQESETRLLRMLSPGLDAAYGEALKRPGLPVAENDIDAVDLLTKIPGSFGTTNLGLLKAGVSRLTILSINGVVPSGKSLEAGSYPLARQFYLVTAAAPAARVSDFAAWLESPAALAMARKLDYLPFK